MCLIFPGLTVTSFSEKNVYFGRIEGAALLLAHVGFQTQRNQVDINKLIINKLTSLNEPFDGD